MTFWKKFAIALAIILALMMVAVGTTMVLWPPINDVTTGETPEYPDLEPRTYEHDIDTVYLASLEAIDDLGLWSVEDSDNPHRIEATRETRLFNFIDDITITLDGDASSTTVYLRSRSRTGEADFGQNARNIHEFYDTLDIQL